MSRILSVAHIERIAYGPALVLQESLVSLRQTGKTGDALLLLEHDPVYTLGRNAKAENLLADAGALEKQGIEVCRTGRGGDITYHGPGQLVGYPVLDLRGHNLGVVAYVSKLEDMLIGVLAEFGVSGSKDPENRGVWIGNSKIAAIGVRITRHVTMHGFSLNVAADLKNYSGIIPCGIRDRGVTSLDRIVSGVSMQQVRSAVVRRFLEDFGYEREVRLDIAEAGGKGHNV